MQEETKENWIDKMVEREATPLSLRDGTVAEFCQKYGIGDSTYYYQSSKPENQEKIVKIALNNTKKHAPEVLENLGERAKNNSKDAEMYLKFILQLAEKTDITSGGLAIQFASIFNKDVKPTQETGGSN